MLEQEIWKDIGGYNGLYRISNKGRVFSVENKLFLKHGKPEWYRGYARVGLINEIGVQVKLYNHRLVAMAFIPNTHSKPYINHINGIKTDNRVENLEWCTAKENTDHAIKIGIFKNMSQEDYSYLRGANNHQSILNEKQVIDIRSSTLTRKELQSIYNVSKTCIAHIITRRKWKHI